MPARVTLRPRDTDFAVIRALLATASTALPQFQGRLDYWVHRSCTPRHRLRIMNEWAPVVQTLLWVTFLCIILWVGRTQFGSIAEAIRKRIEDGSGLRASGPGAISIELEAKNAALKEIPAPTPDALPAAADAEATRIGGNLQAEVPAVIIGPPTSSITGTVTPPIDSASGKDGGLPEWTKHRQAMGAAQRGVHIAHTVAPSITPGLGYDIYAYLVGWGRRRFGLPNDLSDVVRAEFYLGPAWDDEIMQVERRRGKIGIRTTADVPALCIARIEFEDGKTAILSRYLDFEMGEAIKESRYLDFRTNKPRA